MLLPILVASLIAKSIADWLHPHSYYHALMEHSGMMFLPEKVSANMNLDLLPVHLVMSSPVVCVPERASVRQIHAVLDSNKHNGFPVVRKCQIGHVCVGLITRQHLQVCFSTKSSAGFHILECSCSVLSCVNRMTASFQTVCAIDNIRKDVCLFHTFFEDETVGSTRATIFHRSA